MKRRVSNRGFTLVEMIVATLLLAIGVVGALAAFTSSTNASAVAEKIQTASLLAQRHLTETELQADSLSTGEQSGDFGEDYPGFRWRQRVESTDIQNLYRVTVAVQWGPEEAPRERAITTYLRNDREQILQMNLQDEQNRQNQQNQQGGQRPNPGGNPGGGGGAPGGVR